MSSEPAKRGFRRARNAQHRGRDRHLISLHKGIGREARANDWLISTHRPRARGVPEANQECLASLERSAEWRRMQRRRLQDECIGERGFKEEGQEEDEVEEEGRAAGTVRMRRKGEAVTLIRACASHSIVGRAQREESRQLKSRCSASSYYSLIVVLYVAPAPSAPVKRPHWPKQGRPQSSRPQLVIEWASRGLDSSLRRYRSGYRGTGRANSQWIAKRGPAHKYTDDLRSRAPKRLAFACSTSRRRLAACVVTAVLAAGLHKSKTRQISVVDKLSAYVHRTQIR